MNVEQVLAYSTVIFVLLLSPGPSVFLSINNGINYGKKIAATGVLGNVIAFQLLMLVSASGLGAAILTYPEILLAIQIVGACYLCYLGGKIYLSPASQVDSIKDVTCLTLSPWGAFKQAFFVTLLNPKALVFVTALLPQFISHSEKLLPQVIILCAVSAVIHFTVYFSYALLAEKAKRILANEQGRRVYNKASGITFLLFGITLAAANLAH